MGRQQAIRLVDGDDRHIVVVLLHQGSDGSTRQLRQWVARCGECNYTSVSGVPIDAVVATRLHRDDLSGVAAR